MAEAEAPSCFCCKSKVVDAAQVSGEDESKNFIARSKRRRSKNEVSDIIMAKIQEIFGNDVEVFPTKKQRRYRSLVSIYMVTRPVNARVKA